MKLEIGFLLLFVFGILEIGFRLRLISFAWVKQQFRCEGYFGRLDNKIKKFLVEFFRFLFVFYKTIIFFIKQT